MKEDEWVRVGSWVYDHFDEVVVFLSCAFSDHSYKQAPYQDCDKETYEKFKSYLPNSVDWSGLEKYEKEDNTSGSQTMACTGNSCEIVDLT